MTPVVEGEQLETRALTLPEKARAVRITDQATYEVATRLFLDFGALRREIEQYHAPLKAKAWEAHKAIVAAEKKMLEPVVEAEAILNRGITAWTVEQKRLDAERQRQAEEAERRRVEEAQEAAAMDAEKQGASPEEVAAVLSEPIVVPKVAVRPVYKQVAGIRNATFWSAEVFDIRLLCRAVADGKASPELVIPNQPVLNKLAIALKQTLNIPGVKAVSRQSTSRTGRE